MRFCLLHNNHQQRSNGGRGTLQPQSSSEETQDPRSKIEYYTYDEDVEDDIDGTHEMTE